MRKFLLLLIPLILLSCTNYKYEFSKEVEAKVIGSTHRCIGLTYDLFGVEVNQDICKLTNAKMDQFKDLESIPLTAKVEGLDDDTVGTTVEIRLFYKDEEFAASSHTPDYLKPTDFTGIDEKIPGFKWHAYNGMEYNPPITSDELKAKLAEATQKKEEKKDEKTAESKQPEKESNL